MGLSMPSLVIIIPTAGRHELRNCLTSIAYQLEPNDEVIVVGDTLDESLERVEAVVKSFGPQFRYLEYKDSKHTWGHAQINYGSALAKTDYLNYIDDDDVYVPGAIGLIHQQIASGTHSIYLFRFLWYEGFLCWLQQGLFAEGYIGGHCMVCPNNPDKLGIWQDAYTGDWDFVRDTVNLNGGPDKAKWVDECIAVARPTPDVLAEVYRFAENKVHLYA